MNIKGKENKRTVALSWWLILFFSLSRITTNGNKQEEKERNENCEDRGYVQRYVFSQGVNKKSHGLHP